VSRVLYSKLKAKSHASFSVKLDFIFCYRARSKR